MMMKGICMTEGRDGRPRWSEYWITSEEVDILPSTHTCALMPSAVQTESDLGQPR